MYFPCFPQATGFVYDASPGIYGRLSVELDPSSLVTGVWEIGFSSAAGHPIVLSPCVRISEMSYYKVYVVL